MYASTGFTHAAWTCTTTSPLPGFGSGTSSTRITSGPPNSRTRIAFIVFSCNFRLRRGPVSTFQRVHEGADFVVGCLLEIAVPLSDRPERLRSRSADHFIDVLPHDLARRNRRYRHRDHDPRCSFCLERLRCCAHRRTGRKTVIDQDHDPATHVDGRARPSILLFAPQQLLLFYGGDLFNHVLGDSQRLDHVSVPHAL